MKRRSNIKVNVARAIDVAAVRKGSYLIGQTQQTFADAIGVPVKTIRNWEQGRRSPTGSARVLLTMLKRNPRIVAETIGNAPAA